MLRIFKLSIFRVIIFLPRSIHFISLFPNFRSVAEIVWHNDSSEYILWRIVYEEERECARNIFREDL